MKILLSCLSLWLVLAPAPRCQDEEALESIPVEKLSLALIPYSEIVSVDAMEPVVNLYARYINVVQAGGALSEVYNVSDTETGWLVMDTASQVAAIKAAVDRLVAEIAPPQEPAVELQLETYVPRFVEVSRLYELLKPLRRTVLDAPAPGGGREAHVNVNFQESPSLLVLQDTSAQIARMKTLLAQVDRPAPQMLLTCWLVGEGDAGAAPGAALPAELAENLRRLLPWSQPSTVATALLRMSVVAGDERKLEGRFTTSGETQRFELVFKPAGVDETGRLLALQRIQFECSAGQGFDTSAVLTIGEYTVLGVAGDRPLLVALRATPLER